jgi:hypothetical protein
MIKVPEFKQPRLKRPDLKLREFISVWVGFALGTLQAHAALPTPSDNDELYSDSPYLQKAANEVPTALESGARLVSSGDEDPDELSPGSDAEVASSTPSVNGKKLSQSLIRKSSRN